MAGAEREDGAFSGYADPENRPPFASYAAFSASFAVAMAGVLMAARHSGHSLPERIDPVDLVLSGVATHKLSRLIAKDKITAFARAPFTEYQGKGGPAEVEERARGEGLRRTVGELLICPYCLGMWISGGFHAGLLSRPVPPASSHPCSAGLRSRTSSSSPTAPPRTAGRAAARADRRVASSETGG